MTNELRLDKLKEAAKELGCDEDEDRFDANLKKLAKSDADNSDTKKKDEAHE